MFQDFFLPLDHDIRDCIEGNGQVVFMEITTEAAKYSNQLFIDSRRHCPGTVTFLDFSKLPVVSDICIAFANLLREDAVIVPVSALSENPVALGIDHVLCATLPSVFISVAPDE